MENYDPEKCVQPDDFICLICIKKFKNRNGLKLHISNYHLAGTSLKHLTDEKEVPGKDEDDKPASEKVTTTKGKSEPADAKDPLADPVSDPLDTSQDETKKDPIDKSNEGKEKPEEKDSTEVKEESQNGSDKKKEPSNDGNVTKEDGPSR